MTIRRYNASPVIGGLGYGTPEYIQQIYQAVIDNRLTYTTHVMNFGDRLDTLAAINYGAGDLWWIIAAASGIGWGMQVPPDTLIRIPTDLNQVIALIE